MKFKAVVTVQLVEADEPLTPKPLDKIPLLIGATVVMLHDAPSGMMIEMNGAELCAETSAPPGTMAMCAQALRMIADSAKLASDNDPSIKTTIREYNAEGEPITH